MNHIIGAPLNWAIAFFAVFCTAIVALVSWVRFGMKLEDLQAGRRQATVIAITPQRLVVETAGPFGVVGHEIASEQLLGVSIGPDAMRDVDGRARKVDRLLLQLAGGRRFTARSAFRFHANDVLSRTVVYNPLTPCQPHSTPSSDPKARSRGG